MPVNALSLPAEVLCVVFSYLSASNSDIGRAASRHKPGLGWIASATHTCRKWRWIALGFPQLWAENVCCLRSDAATDCFLERAQSMPLVLCAPSLRRPNALTVHQTRIARQHISRIRILEHTSKHNTVIKLARALTATALPHLTVLRLHRREGDGRGSILVPRTLDVPALQELYLEDILFTARAPQLRVLSLKNLEYFLEDDPTDVKSVVLNILRTAPLLETLTLHDMSPDDFGDNNLNSTKTATNILSIQLPRLQQLFLSGYNNGFDLHHDIRVPATADIAISWDADVEPSDTPWLDTLSTLKDHHILSSDYDMLDIREQKPERDVEGDEGGFELWLRSFASLRASDKTKGKPEFRLCARTYLQASDCCTFDEVVDHHFLPYINANSIKILNLGNIGSYKYPDVDVDVVRDVLLRLPSVTTVQLNADPRRLHIRALAQNSAPDSDDGDIVLPALEHLIVEDLSRSQKMSPAKLLASWMVVWDVVEERKLAGRPIRSLTLTEWTKFPGISGEARTELEDVDQQCLSRVERLVEKVCDRRGHEGRSSRIDERVLGEVWILNCL